MNSKTKQYLIMGVAIVYIIALHIYYPQLAEVINTSPVYLALPYFFLGSPQYILMAYIIYERFKDRPVFKRLLASFLITFTLDWVSLPRLLQTDALLGTAAISTSVDAIFMRFFESFGFPHIVSYYLFYIILPIAFVFFAMELLGVTDFIKTAKTAVR